jgi:hypothetical protein
MKRALLTHAIVAVICAVVAIGLVYNMVFLSPTRLPSCDRSESEIGQSRHVAMVEVDCDDAFLHSSTVALSLMGADGKSSSPFLVYDPSGPAPVATWTAPNVLWIEVSDPESIQYARDEMNGIKIRYRLNWRYNDRAHH